MKIAVSSTLVCALTLGVPRAVAQGRRTDNPHGSLPAVLDCSACHSAGAWRPLKARLTFDHDRGAAFRLSGSHRHTRCAACHLDLRFDGPKIASFDCGSCHADVHLGNMAEVCTSCHNTSSFTVVPGLAMHSRTAFPLSGAHTQLTCESCHRDDARGAFTALATDCLGCHAREYNSASFDHGAAGLSTNCEQCHGTLAWGHQVQYGHSADGFPLLGAHARIRCASCHSLPDLGLLFTATDENDCIACHQTDYQRVHAADAFPPECIACHGLETWRGASFAGHDARFPVSSGPHSKAECGTCHVVPQSYAIFSCLECHEHSQARMDEKHHDRKDYVYESGACYNCHPNGRKGG